MSSKKINKNTKIAWRQQIEMIATENSIKMNKHIRQEERKRNGLEADAYFRQYIRDKMMEHVNSGMKKSDAVLKVIKEEKEAVKHLEYLEKAGLDLKVVFYGWIQEKQPRIVGDEER